MHAPQEIHRENDDGYSENNRRSTHHHWNPTTTPNQILVNYQIYLVYQDIPIDDWGMPMDHPAWEIRHRSTHHVYGEFPHCTKGWTPRTHEEDIWLPVDEIQDRYYQAGLEISSTYWPKYK